MIVILQPLDLTREARDRLYEKGALEFLRDFSFTDDTPERLHEVRFQTRLILLQDLEMERLLVIRDRMLGSHPRGKVVDLDLLRHCT